MKDGRVIGLYMNELVEYDHQTLSPLGIVRDENELGNRRVFVVENATALVLVGQNKTDIEIVHPNQDGSYWKKYQRNKRIRQQEKGRQAIVNMWLDKQSKNN